ncbi:hypothetical protein BT93_H1231 [Corymbia citriodora subsp. variegata]|nr:hypothetical protein BT93_H1231 [Corymbia citriodora subsp. variegata]
MLRRKKSTTWERKGNRKYKQNLIHGEATWKQDKASVVYPPAHRHERGLDIALCICEAGKGHCGWLDYHIHQLLDDNIHKLPEIEKANSLMICRI